MTTHLPCKPNNYMQPGWHFIMAMNFKNFALAYVLYGYIALSVFSFDQTYFIQLNTASLDYETINDNFTTTSSISCVIKCKNLVQTCTHAVAKNLGNQNIQCTLIDTGNETNTLVTSSEEMQLWTVGKKTNRLK